MSKRLIENGNNVCVSIVLLLTSCLPRFSCEEWAGDFKDSAKFNCVLSRKETNKYSRGAYFYGTDLMTKKSIVYNDATAWMEHNLYKFKIGDTLIKEKGKYTIIIKRQGKTILLPFECGGKIYVDK